MKLYSVTLKRFRRFVNATMTLEGRVIAITGPNESGKSSILAALDQLNHDEPIPPTSLTFGNRPGLGEEVISARFRLSDEERAAPMPFQPGEAIWLLVGKNAGGERTYRLDPPPVRQVDHRPTAAALVKRSIGSPWFRAWEQDSDDGIPELFSGLATQLSTDAQTLPREALDDLDVSVQALDAWPAGVPPEEGRLLSKTVDALRLLQRVESLPHPAQHVDQLRGAIPIFLNFDERARALRNEYDLANPEHLVLPAFQNLAQIANLDVSALVEAIRIGDVGGIRSHLENAQRRLAELLRNSWKQSSLEVSFDREGTTLRISISSHAAQFFALENRSDGLRIFIALRAFLGERSFAVPPILLVDEAEQHLHYDAQADLVRMFEVQDVAAEVVYTTHSIGCLPQDLGRGVRVVTPDVAGGASTVQNIWTRSHRGGVSPLMEAMGAATLPLAPSRFVVIGEGPSEAMLLPSLLREATEIEALEFQVVSGIAESSDRALRRLEVEAPRVAYVVDGDDAGWLHAKRLKDLGVRAGRVVKLSTRSVGMCLEDLIDPGLYTRAVNAYLRSWPPHKEGFPESDLGRTGRPDALKKWCKENDVPVPSKVLIAEQVLRLLEVPSPPERQRIADAKKRELILGVHAKLLIALGILTKDGTPVLADDAA